MKTLLNITLVVRAAGVFAFLSMMLFPCDAFGGIDEADVRKRCESEAKRKWKEVATRDIEIYSRFATAVSSQLWPNDQRIVSPQADVERTIVDSIVPTNSMESLTKITNTSSVRLMWIDSHFSRIHTAAAITPAGMGRVRLDFQIHDNSADAQWMFLQLVDRESLGPDVKCGPAPFLNCVTAFGGTDRALLYHNVIIHLYFMQRQRFGGSPPPEDIEYVDELMKRFFNHLSKLPLASAEKSKRSAHLSKIPVAKLADQEEGELRITISPEYSKFNLLVNIFPDIATSIAQTPAEIIIKGRFKGAGKFNVQIKGTDAKGHVIDDVVEVDARDW